MSTDPFWDAVEDQIRAFTWSSATTNMERTLAVGNYRGGAVFARDYYLPQIEELQTQLAELKEHAGYLYYHLNGLCEDLYEERYGPNRPCTACYQSCYDYEDWLKEHAQAP